jgi:hypothetical protein
MLTKSFIAHTALVALAAAAPKPQDSYSAAPQASNTAAPVPDFSPSPQPGPPGYTDADASFSVTFDPAETPASVFGPDSQIAVCIHTVLTKYHQLIRPRPSPQHLV